MKHKIVYIGMIFFLTGCIGIGKRLPGNDTSKIFQTIYASKLIDDHVVPGNVDSIYMIKNNYYNKRWPQRSNRFIITYLENSEAVKIPNPLNSKSLDKRIRLCIPTFKVSGDSAIVTLYNFNFGSSLKYILKLKNGEWIIQNQSKGME